MPTATPLQLGPSDLRRTVALCPEIADGLGALYGPDAAADYRARAERIWELNLAHSAVTVLGQLAGGEVAGMAVAVCRGNSADIAFLFVGAAWRNMGYESKLIRALVDRLRSRGVSRIVSECVPLHDFVLDDVYKSLGFLCIPRLLMSVPLAALPVQATGPEQSILLARNTWRGAAECLVAAYHDAPGRVLHLEMTEPGRAEEFIERVHGGAYGTFHTGYARGYYQDAICTGVILGAEAAPGVGFILQVAVEPGFRKRGLGRNLVLDLANQFYQHGMQTMALGVTQSNPARKLYEELGFRPLRTVTAYLWSNPLCPILEGETG